MKTQFKNLKIGDTFVFASEIDHPGWQLAKGPWKKISARRYTCLESGAIHQVGTISVNVYRKEED